MNKYIIKESEGFFLFFLSEKKIDYVAASLRCVGETFLLLGMLIHSSGACTSRHSLKFLFALPSPHQVNLWPLSIFIY